MKDRKLYAPVVALSMQDNIQLLKQLESGFKIIINQNKYQSKVKEMPKIDIQITQLIKVFRE